MDSDTPEWEPPYTAEPEPYANYERRRRWANNAFWLLAGALIGKLTAPWIAVALGMLSVLCLLALLSERMLGRRHHPGCPGIAPPSRPENWLWAVLSWVWRKITGEKEYYP